MRVDSIRIDAFGGLRQVEAGPGLGGFVVVVGENEAGKSSFFEMLVALLYGFYPASRDRNPWAPWDGATASGSAVLCLEGGERLEVVRRLLATPAGSVLRNGREDPLRNDTLAAAAHVPRTIYRQVFALTLGELATLGDDGWEAVQDRLLGALGARDVRSARGVAQELEDAAGTLWRTSRRGNQRVRELEERRRELTGRRADLRALEHRLRDAHRELAGLRSELAGLRTERERCRSRLRHARTVVPVRRALNRIAELEARAGPPELLLRLPGDPPARLAELRRLVYQARTEVERLGGSRGDLQAARDAFGPEVEARLERRSEVEALAGRIAAADPDRVRVGQVQQELRDLRRRLQAALGPLVPEGSASQEGILRLDLSAVRTATDEVLAAQEALDRQRLLQAAAPAHAPPHLSRAVLYGGLAAGVALVAAGALLDLPAATAAGLVLAAGSGALLVAAAGRPARAAAGEAADVESAGARLAETRRRLDAALAGLAAAPSDARGLAALPATLERAQDLARDLAERAETLKELESRLAVLGDDTRALAARLGLEAPDEEAPAATLHRLQAALREAETLRLSAADAGRELAALDDARTRAEEAFRTHRAALDEFEARLAAFGDGDADQGAAEAAARLQAQRRAGDQRDELERAHPDAHEIMARAGEEPAPGAGPDDVDLLTSQEQDLSDRIEAVAGRIRALEAELERLAGRQTLDGLEGEITRLVEEKERLTRERDRLWVLARVLRDADRWVREEHQPELLRRASALLATLTGGRYDRIVVEGEEGRAFKVRGPAVPHPLAVDRPLSTGTREQVYLALRLALLDALDGGGERLPLLLDEVLVNWDRRRRDRGLDALAALAPRRQVFLLTCHPDLAEAAAERGAQIVRLKGP